MPEDDSGPTDAATGSDGIGAESDGTVRAPAGTESPTSLTLLYGLDEPLGPSKGTLYGLQHLLLMLPTTALGPVLLAGGIHASSSQTALLVSATLVAAGLATVLQGWGPARLGARLPVIQGTELFFVPPLVSIGLKSGLGSIAFCVTLGGLMVVVISRFFDRIAQFFPPLVIGTIITLIGVYLIPIGIEHFLGQGSKYFGTGKAFLVGSVTLVCVVAFGFLLRGFLGSLSVIAGIAAGYVVAVLLGMVDFHPVASADWFGLPKFAPMGFHPPDVVSVLVILLLFVVAAVETTGYVSATCDLVGSRDRDERVGRGLTADGIGSVVSGLLGSTPMTAYAQNLGALGITRVGSRYVSIYAGVIVIVLGLVPKVDAVIATVPAPVLGGALLLLFGTVVGFGVRELRDAISSERDLLIFATALSLGVGFALAPAGGLDFLPANLQVALQTGVAIGALAVILLNLVVPDASARAAEDIPAEGAAGA